MEKEKIKKEIVRLFEALKNAKSRFDYFFNVFLKSWNDKVSFTEDPELVFLANEFYSLKCIKFEYELFTNKKIDFVGLLKSNPNEKYYKYENLPQGLESPYEIVLPKTKTNEGVSYIEDLKILRDKVLMHCDPEENYELNEILKLGETIIINCQHYPDGCHTCMNMCDERKNELLKQTELSIIHLQNRKNIIDKYFSLLEVWIPLVLEPEIKFRNKKTH